MSDKYIYIRHSGSFISLDYTFNMSNNSFQEIFDISLENSFFVGADKISNLFQKLIFFAVVDFGNEIFISVFELSFYYQ